MSPSLTNLIDKQDSGNQAVQQCANHGGQYCCDKNRDPANYCCNQNDDSLFFVLPRGNPTATIASLGGPAQATGSNGDAPKGDEPKDDEPKDDDSSKPPETENDDDDSPPPETENKNPSPNPPQVSRPSNPSQPANPATTINANPSP
ncbi:MAG: hypothetical protein Q9172_006612, partial [Xanthocarpia lactea]